MTTMGTPVGVAGFHRSGTSLLAQQLDGAGMHLGADGTGTNVSNTYGHFDDREFVRLHQPEFVFEKGVVEEPHAERRGEPAL